MKLPAEVRVFVSAVFAATAAVPSVNQPPITRPPSAPTYYIAAEAVGCEQDPNYVEFRGASNLPPGALITANVSDFDFDAWKEYGNELSVPVDKAGFFGGNIVPKKGMRLRHNLTLVLTFATFRPKQPDAVLAIIGRKGEKLNEVENITIQGIGRPSANPQIINFSGEYHGLQTIARVPNCGEKD